MKTCLLCILFCIVLASCKKSDDTQQSFTNFNLEFQMDSEVPTVYNIQVSHDGTNYETVGRVSYDPSSKGVYSYNLYLNKSDKVRVAATDDDGMTIYSPVVQAE